MKKKYRSKTEVIYFIIFILIIVASIVTYSVVHGAGAVLRQLWEMQEEQERRDEGLPEVEPAEAAASTTTATTTTPPAGLGPGRPAPRPRLQCLNGAKPDPTGSICMCMDAPGYHNDVNFGPNYVGLTCKDSKCDRKCYSLCSSCLTKGNCTGAPSDAKDCGGPLNSGIWTTNPECLAKSATDNNGGRGCCLVSGPPSDDTSSVYTDSCCLATCGCHPTNSTDTTIGSLWLGGDKTDNAAVTSMHYGLCKNTPGYGDNCWPPTGPISQQLTNSDIGTVKPCSDGAQCVERLLKGDDKGRGRGLIAVCH